MDKKLMNLQINMDEQMHKLIKMEAAYYNMTIKKYVLQAVIERMRRDRELRG